MCLLKKKSSIRAKASDPTHEMLAGIDPLSLAMYVRVTIREAKDYARSSRRQWSQWSVTLQVSTLALSVLATIMLGLAERSLVSNIGLVASSLVAVSSSLEGFFNWRSRWVLAEEALAEWHAIEDGLMVHVASTKPDELKIEDILDFDRRRADAWNRLSSEWIDQRRMNGLNSEKLIV